MRSSVLSRSVIAVASLAIGSAVLIAAPSTAATSTGVTRAEVLATAAALRADATGGAQTSTSQALVRALAAKVCAIPLDSIVLAGGQAVDVPDSVDGLAVTALQDSDDENDGPFFPFGGVDSCTFSAVAPVGASSTFTGDLEVTTMVVNLGGIGGSPVTGDGTATYRLSGDVFTSTPVKVANTLAVSSLRSEGLVTSQNGARVLTLTKIADTKSKAAKKAAKAKYVKRTKAAKKTYAKAVRRAGSNQGKKAQARLAYVSRRSAVKASYKYAVADYKLVKTRSTNAEARPFSVKTTTQFG